MLCTWSTGLPVEDGCPGTEMLDKTRRIWFSQCLQKYTRECAETWLFSANVYVIIITLLRRQKGEIYVREKDYLYSN